MTVRHEAFLALEASLANRLVKAWRGIAAPLIKEIWNALQSGDTAKALQLANGVDLTPIVKDNEKYLRYFAYVALIFGASRLTPSVKRTAAAKGHPDIEDAAQKSIDLLGAAIKYNAEDTIRRALLAAIADFDLTDTSTPLGPSEGIDKFLVWKYDPDQPRAPAGDPEGGQWVASGGGGVKAHDTVPKEVTNFIEKISTDAGGVKGRASAADVADAVAKKYPEQLKTIIDSLDPKFRPTVLLHKGDESKGIPTAWLLGWDDNESTDIHDHRTSEVGVHVLRGTVREKVFACGDECKNPRDAVYKAGKEGISVNTHERDLREGSSIALGSPYIHEVSGLAKDGTTKDITVHAYFPPLSKMTYYTYNPESGRLKFDGEWAEGKEPTEEEKDKKRKEEALKFDPDQPREPAGSSEGGQWTAAAGGMQYDSGKKEWVSSGGPVSDKDQRRLKDMKVPPAWTDVRLNPDAKGALQVIGKDSKGRRQYLYSAEHSERAAAEKFARLKDFNGRVPVIRSTAIRDMQNEKIPKEQRDAAAVVYLIANTGFRIGSKADTQTAHTAFGASTLLGQHVKIDGDKLTFSFVAKKGVRVTKTINDSVLAGYLGNPVKGRPLFSATEETVRDYFHKLSGDNFQVRDLRTWQGTAKALEKATKMRVPSSEKEFKKWRREIAVTVAKHLGNTPAVALSAYIDPAVFKPWSEKWSARKADTPDERQQVMDEYFETHQYDQARDWRMVPETDFDPDDGGTGWELVLKFNPYHDERGRFATEAGGVSLGEDLKLQVEWLGKKARSFGYKSLEEMQRVNPEAFAGLAEEWRKTHVVKYGSGEELVEFKKQIQKLEDYEIAVEGEIRKFDMVQGFTSFRDDIGSAAGDSLQLIASLHTSRLSAYGFTVEADVRGFSRYAISAQLDDRVCPICEYMDGKEFDVTDAQAALTEIFGVDNPDDLKTVQPWPDQSKAGVEEFKALSDDDLVERNWHLPPWHPHDRCLLVSVGEAHGIETTASYQAVFGRPIEEVLVLPAVAAAGLEVPAVEDIRDTLGGLAGDGLIVAWNRLKDEYGVDVLEEITGVLDADVQAGTAQIQFELFA